MTILNHLEKVHRELQGEHIQDQVNGGELRRQHALTTSEFEIGREGEETEKYLLVRQVEHLNDVIDLIKTDIESENAETEKINSSDMKENINERGMSDSAVLLRKENDTLFQTYNDTLKSHSKENDSTTKFVREHDGVMREYTDTVGKYNNLLSKVRDEIVNVETEKVGHDAKLLSAVNKRDDLVTRKGHSL